ncbi:MAG: hypothetical protein LKM30_04415 [Bacilli bacterium]|jgi:hypothetical protein|nr:hypothetical protein [Bacilli bacterium]
MGYLLYPERSIDIAFTPLYKKAVFSFFHVAFVDNSNSFFLSSDDKESLVAALEFYHDRVLAQPSFPYFDGSTFALRPSSDKGVLRQILGIPESIFNHLDLTKSILPQLSFAEKTGPLKKQVYLSFYSRTGNKWYRDDFKLYCLSQGFFFLYDETKPFISGAKKELPVYINEARLEKKIMLPLYREATSQRFTIDFVSDLQDQDFLQEMTKYDDFSFDERLDYFVNNNYNPALADLGPSQDFKNRYSLILRQYLSCLINVLYDLYSFRVLNKVTQKMSFLSQSRVNGNSKRYALSSYNAEMFSLDRKEWYFSKDDEDVIRSLIEDALAEDPKASPLCFYARLGLPYQGYRYVKDLKELSVKKVLAALPFKKSKDVVGMFLSAKRFDSTYSYLTGEKEHRYVYLVRQLYRQGVLFDCEQPFTGDLDSVVTVTLKPLARYPELSLLFDKPGFSLRNDLYLAYEFNDDGGGDSLSLPQTLSEIDMLSKNNGAPLFFGLLKHVSIRQAVNSLLLSLGIVRTPEPDVYRFFQYLVFYPLKIVLNQARLKAIHKKDTETLVALDGYTNPTETYEPNLPYPFVSYGALCYSFRETFFSKPYLCSSEKDALEARMAYYSKTYDRGKSTKVKAAKGYLFDRNVFVISHLGLPENIVTLLNPNKELLPQIPFKDHICHLCRDSQPSYYDKIDSETAASYNVFMTYIRAQASRKGVYFDKLLNDDDRLSKIFESSQNGNYHSLMDFNPVAVDPFLKPYLRYDEKAIASLISAFFPSEVILSYFTPGLDEFLDLGSDTIRKILFDCDASLMPIINKNINIFAVMVYIENMIERAYAIHVSRPLIPSLKECAFTLNQDENSHLPYPYVLLGRIYNGYKSSADSPDIYFCQCDKESILTFVSAFYEMTTRVHVRKDIQTAIVLGLVGLPYEAILKYSDYDLSLGSPEGLVNQMLFRDSICRRCTNINHAALSIPFTKAFPNKDDMSAELVFAENKMAHDHIMFFGFFNPERYAYDPSYRFDLDSSNDEMIPVIYTGEDQPTLPVYSFFTMTLEKLKDYLSGFSKLNSDRAEILAYASSVILDSYKKNNHLFFEFFFLEENNPTPSLFEQVQEHFPELSRIRNEAKRDTAQMILGFLSYLIWEFIRNYALDERRVGQ